MNTALNNLIQSARGLKPVDLLLKNCRLVNVLTGEAYNSSVAIDQGFIAGFGDDYQANETIDLKGLYLAPGFIDGHIHIESSFLSPAEFSRTVLPHGTTSVVCDPHEIANVTGLDGIKYFLEANTLINIFVMLPSCVPATHLETSGACLNAKDLLKLSRHPYVLGLAEMMNYPGVLFGNKDVLDKLEAFPLIDGHAPMLKGKDLYAYIAAGISSDHECTGVEEAKEKLRSGMHLMIREGTAAKNLSALIKAITPQNSRRCLLVSDDRHPNELIQYGHLDYTLRKAVKLGLSPITAIQMVTINPAEYFGLKRIGAIIPGYHADLVAFDNLREFNVKYVFKKGKEIPPKNKSRATDYTDSKILNLPPLKENDFEIKPQSQSDIKVIEIIPHQIITKKLITTPLIQDGLIVSNIKSDILKIAVINRHSSKKSIGLGFVKGFGLKKGAIASTVAHDSHNLIIIGTNDSDMLFAANTIRKIKGGQAVVTDGKVKAQMPLPIGGIMSDKPAKVIARNITKLNQAAYGLGCTIKEPFMTMSFLALPVIPELKITDKGLVDVGKFCLVPLQDSK